MKIFPKWLKVLLFELLELRMGGIKNGGLFSALVIEKRKKVHSPQKEPPWDKNTDPKVNCPELRVHYRDEKMTRVYLSNNL